MSGTQDESKGRKPCEKRLPQQRSAFLTSTFFAGSGGNAKGIISLGNKWYNYIHSSSSASIVTMQVRTSRAVYVSRINTVQLVHE